MSLEAKLRYSSLPSMTFTKPLPDWFMPKLVDVKPLRWLFPLRTSFGLNTDGEFGYNQLMVCPAVCTTHCLGDPYILSVLPSGDDKLNQVPVSGAWVHPRRPVSMGQAEYSVRDEQFMFCASS